jgi:hypothetical protein
VRKAQNTGAGSKEEEREERREERGERRAERGDMREERGKAQSGKAQESGLYEMGDVREIIEAHEAREPMA